MNKLGMTALIAAILFAGCSGRFVTLESTLKEEPFAAETMRGTVAEASQCVAQYWKQAALPAGSWWKANPESQPLLASGIGIGFARAAPPVSLIIAFEEKDGKTLARARMHSSLSSKDGRRNIALSSLAACRDNSDSYYGGVKAIVLTTGDVIEGRILSIIDDELKIRTNDGRILFFSFMNDIKKYIMK